MRYFLILCYNSDTQSFEDMKLEEKTGMFGRKKNNFYRYMFQKSFMPLFASL